jgi:hypothetical protein
MTNIDHKPERDIIDQLLSYANDAAFEHHAEVPKSVLHAAISEIERLRKLAREIDTMDDFED